MGRPRRIDRGAVLDASLALADDAGLASVTMQGVAARLGVTPMALYHHVAGKADLLDGIVERLLAELPPPAPALAWDARLVALGGALREVARRHPAAFPLLLQRPAVTAGARSVRAQVYGVLREAGVARAQVVRVERMISTLAIGYAAGEATGRFSGTPAALAREYRALATFIRAGIEPFRAARATAHRRPRSRRTTAARARDR